MPGLFADEQLFENAEALLGTLGDDAFFAPMNEGAAADGGWSDLGLRWDRERFRPRWRRPIRRCAPSCSPRWSRPTSAAGSRRRGHSSTSTLAKAGNDAAKQTGREHFERRARVVSDALTGRDYLLGGEFSAADVMVGAALGWARGAGLLDGWPVLLDYGRRVGGRPAAKRARAD